MLKSANTGLRDVPFPIEDPERIPAQRYYDAEFYQMELDHVWPHVWQNACRIEQIPDEGDWIEYQNVGKSVLIVNTKDGIKAFHNACRHRGVPIAGNPLKDDLTGGGHGNCRKSGFVCPFHGWRWNAEGENTLVYGKHLFSERQLDPADINLVPCRVDTAIGCVWINFDDDAPSLRESIGPLIDRLEAHNLHKLRAEWQFGTVLPANWKVAMEAFMEGYHVMKTHPQLQAAHPEMYGSMYEKPRGPMPQMADPELSHTENQRIQVGSMALLSEGMAGMLHAKELEIARGMVGIEEGLPEDKNMAVFQWLGMVMHQISTQLQARGEPVPDLCAVTQSDPIKSVEFLFPHYFLLPYFSSFSAYRIRPLGPESCFFELWSLTTFPEGEEPEPVMEPTILPYDSQEFPPIPRQDYANIPIQQQGMHAKGFEFMRLSRDVEGMISNYQRIIDGYISGVPQEKLAQANQLLAGNFDGPILEFDF
ncbi:aromatic ring-hydroxylating dioxygenase subunit alpha [Novosphingobium sp. PS1R-30]|uniref:Aromatic ring-hydroxylating dioxygenase subunit alpha n=1 Tax=Novosphingobium anseongense TaxID=3133436 RepID=A0ABU8RTW1_9SPHN